jgi:hypothetical protein
MNHLHDPLTVLAIPLCMVGRLSLMNESAVGYAEDLGSSGDVASDRLKCY